MSLTHIELVALAARWLRSTRRCRVVLTEFVSAHYETPDAIGWRCGTHSIMVECKVSRADFFRDAKKFSRTHGGGIGQERWYLTPPGLVKSSEVPEKWGLLEVSGSRIRRVKETRPERLVAEVSQKEVVLLVSALSRHQISSGLENPLTIQERRAVLQARNTTHSAPQEKNSAPLLSGGESVETTQAEGFPPARNIGSPASEPCSDQSGPRGSANHHG